MMRATGYNKTSTDCSRNTDSRKSAVYDRQIVPFSYCLSTLFHDHEWTRLSTIRSGGRQIRHKFKFRHPAIAYTLSQDMKSWTNPVSILTVACSRTWSCSFIPPSPVRQLWRLTTGHTCRNETSSSVDTSALRHRAQKLVPAATARLDRGSAHFHRHPRPPRRFPLPFFKRSSRARYRYSSQ